MSRGVRMKNVRYSRFIMILTINSIYLTAKMIYNYMNMYIWTLNVSNDKETNFL